MKLPHPSPRQILSIFSSMLLLLACGTGHGQGSPGVASEVLESAPVMFRGTTLFDVSSGIGSLGVAERAQAIERRVGTAAQDAETPLDALQAVERGSSTDLLLGQHLLLTITDEEAAALGRTRAQLAADRRVALATALARDRQDRSYRQLLLSAAMSAAALLLFAVFAYALIRGTASAGRRIERLRPRLVDVLGPRLSRLLSPAAIADALFGMVRLLALITGLVVFYFVLQFVLSRFPWTRGLADELMENGADALSWLGGGLLGYLPKALNVLLIIVVTRYLIRLARWGFLQVERGSVTLSGFYPEWAQPTYQIVRFFMLAFAAVAAFPYLPGSGSEGFRGISLLLGVMVSLGAASAVANIIAGLVLTYMRPFRLGERVRIADTVGDVIGKDLFVVRMRTIKNVDVTIPNSLVLANHIVNYSSSAESHGLVLHTTVTIGYDVPWRRVHELLLEAARRTDGIVDQPVPFVLQTGLDDFYPRYELNAFTRDPGRMSVIYSALHANIQDAFNEAGVEIMSPHYVAARDGNRTAIPDDYLPKNYQPAGFALNWPRRSPTPQG
ncbi:MAG: mechanosensitive ion channel family protein [Steroidobacteraceae bacterium]